MGTTLFVGNLPQNVSQIGLTQLFSQYGEVYAVAIKKDRFTQRTYAFIRVSDRDFHNITQRLHGHPYNGLKLVVREANERKS